MDRVRIRTAQGLPPGHHSTGRDLGVLVVHEDGSEHPLHGVTAVYVTIACEGRSDSVKAVVVLQGAEVDVVADLERVKGAPPGA